MKKISYTGWMVRRDISKLKRWAWWRTVFRALSFVTMGVYLGVVLCWVVVHRFVPDAYQDIEVWLDRWKFELMFVIFSFFLIISGFRFLGNLKGPTTEKLTFPDHVGWHAIDVCVAVGVFLVCAIGAVWVNR